MWTNGKKKIHLQGRVSHSRHLQWLTETLQFLLMVYSRLYISLHIFQMFCVGCWKLPGLIQCSLCHRQQGAGPLLCMTEWNEAAELRRGVNTTLNTALPQLHTPDFRLLPHSHFPQQIRCSTRSGTLPPLEFSGRGAQRGVDASNWLLPERFPPLSWLSLPESPQALAAAVECTVEGKEGIWYSKPLWLFFYHHTDTNNQFFILCLEAIQLFFLSLWSLQE